MVLQKPIIISQGDLFAEVDPEFGGRVTAFWSEVSTERIDWFSPTPGDGRDVAAPHKTGMFPLVPFSNRIRDARFRFAGKDCAVEASEPGRPHAIHGHGHHAVWSVADSTAGSVGLTMTHDGSDWPASYLAEQQITLRDGAMELCLAVECLGPGPMPVGLGWHPFLPARGGAALATGFETVWPAISDSIPDRAEPLPAHLDFTAGRALPGGLDTGFGGWSGNATVTWPDDGLALAFTAAPPLDHVILFTPLERGFFCLEPVSHAINAINTVPFGDGEGMRVIEPGERMAVSLTVRPLTPSFQN
jgi:aldose 1-epimerase